MIAKTENDKQDQEGAGKAAQLGTTGLSPDKRDANDQKVMANSPDNKPGRLVPASLQTLNDSDNSPISTYYEFPSSKTQSYDTYPKRVGAIMNALGNKDEVKG